MTPVALPDDLEIWVDARIMACDRVILGGGDRSRKIWVEPRLLEELPGATVVEGLALETAAVSGTRPAAGTRRGEPDRRAGPTYRTGVQDRRRRGPDRRTGASGAA